ncbi:MAG: hypothetical protein ACRC9P_01685 [Bacteroides sp.]
MKRSIHFVLSFFCGSFLLGLAACSSSDQEDVAFKPATLISFEEPDLALAGPTAAGENLFPDYSPSTAFPAFTREEKHPYLLYGVCESEAGFDYELGGVVRSNYSSYSPLTPEALADAAWYGPENRLSVYRAAGAQAGKSGDYFLMAKGAGAYLQFKEPCMLLSFYVANAAAVIGKAYEQHVQTEKTVVAQLYVRGYWGDEVVLDSAIRMFSLHEEMSEDELRQLQNWKRIELAYPEASLQKLDRLEFQLSFSNQAGDFFEEIPEQLCLDHLQFKTE